MVNSSCAFSPRSGSVAVRRPTSTPGAASSDTENDHAPAGGRRGQKGGGEQWMEQFESCLWMFMRTLFGCIFGSKQSWHYANACSCSPAQISWWSLRHCSLSIIVIAAYHWSACVWKWLVHATIAVNHSRNNKSSRGNANLWKWVNTTLFLWKNELYKATVIGRINMFIMEGQETLVNNKKKLKRIPFNQINEANKQKSCFVFRILIYVHLIMCVWKYFSFLQEI